jgi:hypothetical protein
VYGGMETRVSKNLWCVYSACRVLVCLYLGFGVLNLGSLSTGHFGIRWAFMFIL